MRLIVDAVCTIPVAYLSFILFLISSLGFLIFSMINPRWSDFVQIFSFGILIPLYIASEPLSLLLLLIFTIIFSCFNIKNWWQNRVQLQGIDKLKRIMMCILPIIGTLAGFLLIFILALWA